MVPIIERLIVAYASFPFTTPAVLTKDALCRAILLLTDRGWSCFRQGKQTGSNVQIRSRPLSRQLSFLYSALVCPPTGVPTQENVLDVVCRLRYPCDIQEGTILKGLNYLQRHPYTEFVPLAERLEPSQDPPRNLEPLPISQLQLLQTFVAAFTPPWLPKAVPPRFEDSECMNEEQFVQWAEEACKVLYERFSFVLKLGRLGYFSVCTIFSRCFSHLCGDRRQQICVAYQGVT